MLRKETSVMTISNNMAMIVRAKTRVKPCRLVRAARLEGGVDREGGKGKPPVWTFRKLIQCRITPRTPYTTT
jgi:hypothetical protein